MRTTRRLSGLILAAYLTPWRIIRLALHYRSTRARHPELFDGKAALEAIAAAIREDGYGQ